MNQTQLDEGGKCHWFIEQRRARFGSLAGCEIKLSHPTVSRTHARLELDSLGYRLIDENSKNGVWINQVRIRDAYLSDGDMVQIGGVTLQFHLQKQKIHQFSLWRENSFGGLLGSSMMMREIFALLERAARSDASVLIHGESGTGKELAARALHERSPRAAKPFIVFDCSAVPATLVESELFGHVHGAFTGATSPRLGAFAAAEGGTLFLDEIGELPLDLQPKLLRVLERHEFKPVGADHYRAVNVRVISATHRQLDQELKQERFRLDLLYRLAVIQVTLPPLRDHAEDIPELVDHFLNEFSPLIKREISFRTMQRLIQHQWPGNVRELKNYVHRAIALSSSEESHLETRFLLPEQTEVNSHASTQPTGLESSVADPSIDSSRSSPSLQLQIDTSLAYKEAKRDLVDHFEKLYWQELLSTHHNNISAAARVAGIHRKSAEYLVKKLGLKRSE